MRKQVMGEEEMEEGRKRDGEIKAAREGGGWRFTRENEVRLE